MSAISVPVPANEADRLARLARYGILDKPPEPAFDDLTQIAAHICQTPICLISLVDAARQWFLSRVGLDATETPRNLAFCAHAILQEDLFVVVNALKDSRFADNPLVVSDPNIRFYAGAPLRTADGIALGTLCVIDRVPRRLNATQREALQALAQQVVALLERREYVHELKRKEPARSKRKRSPQPASFPAASARIRAKECLLPRQENTPTLPRSCSELPLLSLVSAASPVPKADAKRQSERASHLMLTQAYDATIEGWSRLLDLRDKETEGHSERVTQVSLQLARRMNMNETELRYLRWGALLHDIGKMGVPDHILLKPGPLTEEEWEIMRRHPTYAYEMLSPIVFLKPALAIPYCHHEKWDGTGYPRGLKGRQIPLAARIFTVVDVWDALRSDRPYRKALPEERVLTMLAEQSGTHFDPDIVQVFLRMLTTEKQFSDSPPARRAAQRRSKAPLLMQAA